MVLRLGTGHWVVLVVALAAIGTMVALGLSYDVRAWYWRDMVGAQLRNDLGFATGYVEADGERMFGVTWVVPDGPFSRAEVRAGDVFVSGHGYTETLFYSILEGARGGNATLELRRSPDWRPVRVTVAVPAK